MRLIAVLACCATAAALSNSAEVDFQNSPYRFENLPHDMLEVLGQVLRPSKLHKSPANCGGHILVTRSGMHESNLDQLRALSWGLWIAAASGRQLHVDGELLGNFHHRRYTTLSSLQDLVHSQQVLASCEGTQLSATTQELAGTYDDHSQCRHSQLLEHALQSSAAVLVLHTNCASFGPLPAVHQPALAAHSTAVHQQCIEGKQEINVLDMSSEPAVNATRHINRPGDATESAVDAQIFVPSTGKAEPIQWKPLTGAHLKCAGMIIHATWAVRLPSLGRELRSIAALFRDWAQLFAPEGFRALHVEVGRSWLYLNDECTLAALPGSDPESPVHNTSVVGDAWLKWAQTTADMQLPHQMATLTVLSDSKTLSGEIATRLWSSTPVIHCCTDHPNAVLPPIASATASRVAADGDSGSAYAAAANSKLHSAAHQFVFDLYMTAAATEVVASDTTFWQLAAHWSGWQQGPVLVLYDPAQHLSVTAAGSFLRTAQPAPKTHM